jgi:alkylation response protein AidB-like acyl-CoA dehydrogenase
MTPDELDDWRRVVFDAVAKTCPIDRVRGLRDSEGPGWDSDAWERLLEIGLPSAHVPESLAGGGGGLEAAAVVLEACGRYLVPEPVTSSFLATTFVLHAGDSSQLERLASGERLAVAVPTRERHIAMDPDGAGAVVIPGERGLVVDPAPNFGARGILIDGRRVSVVAGGSIGTSPVLDRALAQAHVGLAAELIGVAEAALDLTVIHLRDRCQFGMPLASFQALRHRVARLHVELVLARAVVSFAVLTPSTLLAAAAKARAGALAVHITAEGIQLHGGLGMTDEGDIGLYFKRAWVLDQLLGDAAQHRTRFGDVLYSLETL